MAKDRKKPEEKEEEPDDSWKRFGQVVQAAMSVPKEEVKESMEREKEEKKGKPILHRKEVKKRSEVEKKLQEKKPKQVAKNKT